MLNGRCPLVELAVPQNWSHTRIICQSHLSWRRDSTTASTDTRFVVVRAGTASRASDRPRVERCHGQLACSECCDARWIRSERIERKPVLSLWSGLSDPEVSRPDSSTIAFRVTALASSPAVRSPGANRTTLSFGGRRYDGTPPLSALWYLVRPSSSLFRKSIFELGHGRERENRVKSPWVTNNRGSSIWSEHVPQTSTRPGSGDA